jgi:formate dehydrogenase gamma subunit
MCQVMARQYDGRRLNEGIRLAAVLIMAAWIATAPLQAATDCLACHAAGSGMTNSKGKDITVHAESLKNSVHKDLSCVDCHAGAAKEGHTAKTASASCLTCHPDEGQTLAASAHAALGEAGTSEACIACHTEHSVAKPVPGNIKLCATCHDQEVRDFAGSVHGVAHDHGNDDAPSCQDCHGPAHQVTPPTDANSRVNPRNLPATCGRCHSNPKLAQKYMFSVAKPVEAYEHSVHARAIRDGKQAASCDDCHGVHTIRPASDPRSPINKLNVATTCAKCHGDIYKQYKESIHGRAVASGVREAPTCTDCHGEHDILATTDPNSPVYVTNIATVTCSRCHADQRLMKQFNLPSDREATYESSYHGLAARAGSQTVANCASCHGVHNILPSSDPRSTVNKANLARTCGKCHPDAGKRFAMGSVHVVPPSGEGGKVLAFVKIFYLFTIPLTLGFMFLHNFLDWLKKARRSLAKYRSFSTPVRLSLSERVQHVVLLISFLTLVITGFALKFPGSFWAAPIVAWEKDFPLRGLVHRIAAVVLCAAAVYHLIYLLFTIQGRQRLRDMRPRPRDARDLVHTFGYYLGYRPTMPQYPRFNYAEKMEYWALVWGTIIMALTGFALWAHNFVLENFPKWFTDVATSVHYYEAILATAAIVIWHFYAVIFDPDVYPLKWTVLTGRAPEHEIREGEEEAPPPEKPKTVVAKVPAPKPPAQPTADSHPVAEQPVKGAPKLEGNPTKKSVN